MNNTNDYEKKFDDPLLSGLQDTKLTRSRSRTNSRSAHSASNQNSNALFITGLLIVAALSVLGYFLYQAQKNIDSLSTELNESRSQLSEVQTNLEESRNQLGSLTDELGESNQKIVSQDRKISEYKNLYEGLKTNQEDQNREIQALNVQKANQSEVDGLKTETSQLREDTSQLSQGLEETRTNVASLEQKTDVNQGQIDQNRSQLELVRSSVDTNTGEIGEIKKSLEREYYNFELQEDGGYMKVLNVSLSLKDTDIKKRQFDLYLLADGKVIRKKDHPINTPILFYVEGKKKPYEVVVTRVDKKLVVGYLSVPKV